MTPLRPRSGDRVHVVDDLEHLVELRVPLGRRAEQDHVTDAEAAEHLLAVVHGAVDLALGGHLARDGEGHADPSDLVDDLLSSLRPT